MAASSSQWYKEELQLNELHHKPTPKEIWSDPKNWTHGQPYMPRDHVLSVDSLKPHLPHVKSNNSKLPFFYKLSKSI